uniref:Reverse transcriptase domain-containing protein n=1 Tax=Leptobrachium leishanense TaxID=445787 RepID=A0A8C5LZP1_9ANUR
MAAASGFSPKSLRFLTYNVNGLNTPEKRRRLFRELRALRTSVAFLQETHFKSGVSPILRDPTFPVGYFSDHCQSKSRGVAILFARDVPMTLGEVLSDENGRFLFVKCSIAESVYTFASIYLPNSNQHRALASILRRLDAFKSGTLVVAGDFNVPLDPRIDTSAGRSSTPLNVLRHMRRSLDSLQLVDVWRAFHAGERDYTFYSPVHSSYSRLDYLFVQQHTVLNVVDSAIQAQTWSDHCPLLITFSSPLSRPSERQWRLNTTLLQDPALRQEIATCLSNYFLDNENTEVSFATIWEAHKAVLRGIFISRATALKRERSEKLRALFAEIRDLELSHHSSALTSDYALLVSKRRALNDILNADVRFMAQRARCFFALKENKPGKYLARLLRKKREATHIARIRLTEGVLTSRPDRILEEFRSFYERLYHIDDDSDRTPPQAEIEEYLDGTLNRTLPPADAEVLGGPISAEELKGVITALKLGKCPGPDGFPAEYYQTFTDELLPHLASLFSRLKEGELFHPHTLSATISVIRKPGKDESDVRNYRPISLLNTDLKILSKILANRLAPLLPSLIHSDQVGFIPGREARDATTRALGVIGLAKASGTGLLLLSTDAEKAFDRVRWGFLFSVLWRVGVGDSFLRWTEALYCNPTARVRANGALSHSFDIRNGTRQGCPLSPLLFAISLEPLLESIRLNAGITGIQGHSSEHKVAAYADDLMFFVTNPVSSLPTLTRTLDDYGVAAGYRINQDKSEFLNISLRHSSVSLIRREYPFRYCTVRMKYLGVWLAASSRQIFDLNFLAILGTFVADLNGKMLSWFGRIAVLKMNLLPRLLYLFNTLPISIPVSFFTTLRKELLRFIWTQGRPRVSFKVLCLPKSRGGLALPDPRKYYLASHMARVVEWSTQKLDKRWLDVERALSPRPLWTLPWLPPSCLTDTRHDPDPVLNTLRLWHSSKLMFGFSSALSPLLPLMHNPGLSGGVLPSLRDRLSDSGRLRALDLPPDGRLDLFPRSVAVGPLSLLERFNFAQIKSYLTSLNCGYSLSRPLLPFETLCHLGLPLTRGVSKIYGLIMAADTEDPPFMSRWDQELGLTCNSAQWTNTFTLVHKGCGANRVQETSYKVLSFWYRTPSFLHRIFPLTSSVCWRCNNAEGTYLHIWWACPPLLEFWRTVHGAILRVTGVDLSLSPACFLLFHIALPLKTLKRSVLMSMLLAARSLVPVLWRTDRIPSTREWIGRVEVLRSIDHREAADRGVSADFATKWYYWEEYAASLRS